MREKKCVPRFHTNICISCGGQKNIFSLHFEIIYGVFIKVIEYNFLLVMKRTNNSSNGKHLTRCNDAIQGTTAFNLMLIILCYEIFSL